MSDVKLLPCPFCGESRPENGESTFGLSIAKTRVWWIQCCTCGGEGPSRGDIASLKTKKAAIAAWNARPAPALTPTVQHLQADASWAATHRSELADLRDAFSKAEQRIRELEAAALTPKQEAADEMAKALKAVEEANQIGSWVPAMNKVRAALAKAGQQ